MKTLFDSSAFAKRYIHEPGSDEVDTLCQEATAVGLCILCVPEILSALNRRVRERRLTGRDYATAKRHLLDDVADAEILNLTPPVVAQTALLLEQHPLRTLDAVHVACALVWGAELFVTGDQRQALAARQASLVTRLLASV